MATGLPLTLPTRLRDRLARAILDARHDRRARDELDRLAGPRATTGVDWVAGAGPAEMDTIRARARAASAALATRVPSGPDDVAEVALADAALLFEAGLFFEVHELLEPWWRAASGAPREGLQGLIQVAVGLQHLASGNRHGARALLESGSARLIGRRLAGADLTGFGRAIRRVSVLVDATEFDWTLLPGFPRPGGGPAAGVG